MSILEDIITMILVVLPEATLSILSICMFFKINRKNVIITTIFYTTVIGYILNCLDIQGATYQLIFFIGVSTGLYLNKVEYNFIKLFCVFYSIVFIMGIVELLCIYPALFALGKTIEQFRYDYLLVVIFSVAIRMIEGFILYVAYKLKFKEG